MMITQRARIFCQYQFLKGQTRDLGRIDRVCRRDESHSRTGKQAHEYLHREAFFRKGGKNMPVQQSSTSTLIFL